MPNKKKVRILSIDGGGIRGILPGVILARLEKKLQEKTNNPALRLADKFDFVAGTSTGGILGLTYLFPDRTGKKPKFSAQDAVNLYLDRGDEIFDVTLGQKIKSFGGVTDEKYSADEIEEALMDNFGDTKLNALLKPCLITAYDIRNRKAFFFRQHKADIDINNFKVRDVARATSAAPTYFEVSRVKNDLGSPFPLVDGGVFANNPTLCAYSEVRGMDISGIEKPSAKDMFIVSLGTGSIKKSYPYKAAKDWGQLQWIKPVIDIMMSGNSETVHYHLMQIFDTLSKSDKADYYRLEPDLGNANNEMDDASPENLKALEESAISFISKSEINEQLDEIATKLLKYE
jgi:patatin-like phospholipase/acyl hydrolase